MALLYCSDLALYRRICSLACVADAGKTGWLATRFCIFIEIFKFSLCFADQATPGAFEKQVAVAPKSLLLALVCGELLNSEK